MPVYVFKRKERKKDSSLTAPLEFSNPVDLILKLSTDDKVFKSLRVFSKSSMFSKMKHNSIFLASSDFVHAEFYR